MSLSIAALLSFDELDVVQLAPKFACYEQPVATTVVSNAVKFVVIIRFVRINADQVDFSFHGSSHRVDDHDDVFRVHIGINLTVDVFQLVKAIQWPFAIIYFDKSFFGVRVFVEELKAARTIRKNQSISFEAQLLSFFERSITTILKPGKCTSNVDKTDVIAPSQENHFIAEECQSFAEIFINQRRALYNVPGLQIP